MNRICPICNREYGGEMQDHHLKPKTFRSRTNEVHDQNNLVTIHKICHSAIHAFFNEKELFKKYNTVQSLVAHPSMINFIKWVNKKPPEFYTSMRWSNRRK